MMFVLGLVGPFGSGCSYVSEMIQQEYEFKFLSLSNILREEFRRQYPEVKETRSQLQDFGNEMRKAHSIGYFAEKACEIIDNDPS